MKRFFLYLAVSCSTAFPVLAAGQADGFYKATKVEGYVTLAGEKMDLPINALRQALLESGIVVVKNNRIPIRKMKWEKVLEDFQFKDIRGNATSTAPSDIVLRKNGNHFKGRAKTPLVVTQKGKYKKGWFSVSVKVKMRTHLDTFIHKDGTLIMKAPISVKAIDLTARGWIFLEARKQEIFSSFSSY